MLFEALTSGAFDHLNCQHTGEFHQDNFFQNSQMPMVLAGGSEIDFYIISLTILAINLSRYSCFTFA